ncbi:MAG: ABC transporter permease [Clostridia bacterium]|nr:ABC transporter permease [Clostridia bacterium]
MLKEIWDYRQMIISLVRKDLRGRYKGSVLGFMWTFINPLFQLIVYSFVFSTILRSNIEKYYLFLFVALIPWIFFSAAITGGSTSVLSQKDLVKKIYFPREVLPIAYVTSCFVNMLLCFIVVFVVVFISGTKLSILGLVYLPIVMIVEYILALGIAMITSAVTVYFRDLEHILGIISMAWMYFTPVVYSQDLILDSGMPEKFKFLFMHVNPMTSIINAYRTILYYGAAPDMSTLVEAVFLGVIFLVVGLLIFSKLKKHFAEEL